MDDPTRFSNPQDGEEQQAFEKTWNDVDALPTTHFNPLTDQFEAGAETSDSASAEAEDQTGLADKVNDLKDKATQAAGTVQEKTHHLTDQGHAMSDKGLDSAAAGLGQAASMLRQQGDAHEGTLGTAATRTAETLEQASTYLQDKDTDQLMADIEAMVRKRPVESVLVAAGIGYLLSKVFS